MMKNEASTIANVAEADTETNARLSAPITDIDNPMMIPFL